ncbi:polyamine-transporting ATPase 13A3-like [Apostichopus japonicus]|uniref:polyamine-transporting ATPase 13A3-like n=1 Tax=Stichopus japonicus TaxID=307972 RepID=UPI003AB62E09
MTGDTMTGAKSPRRVLRDENESLWECYFYRANLIKQIFWYTLGLLSAGLLYLIFFWRKDWKLLMTHDLVGGIDKATSVLVKTADGMKYVSQLVKEVYGADEKSLLTSSLSVVAGSEVVTVDGMLVYFHLQKIKYIWNNTKQEFFLLRGMSKDIECSEFHEEYKRGLEEKDVRERLKFFGKNNIVVKVKPILVMLFQEALHPFYVFQAFSVTVWCLNEYVIYSVVIVVISVLSISISLYTTRTQLTTLKKMVASHMSVTVLRGGKQIDIPESEIVPGDVMVIPWGGCTLTCDAVLLTGNCVVNESMLTGESVPVTKTYIPHSKDSNEMYNTASHLRHTLLCGTKVIQTRSQEQLLAVVTNTGFATMKGKLVHSILYPVPSTIKLYRDAVHFVLLLSCVAAVGFIYDAIILSTMHEASVREIIFSSADVITIAVAPALPAALTIGMVYAQLRLKAAGIFCINPPKINLCGMMDVICFDKTGTLTEDGLDFYGIHQVIGGSLSGLLTTLQDIATGPALSVLASCHTLTHIKGELVGDPLDIKMFLATDWALMEPTGENSESDAANKRLLVRNHKVHEGTLEVVKLFPFVSSLQRMSVLARTDALSPITVYSKGAPEKIASLCDPETVPHNFKGILESHTRKGFRVIGLATKVLATDVTFTEADQTNRTKLESGLSFVGLLVMQNQLKPETVTVFHQLHAAEKRTIMLTGDNILTAIHIAQESGMFQQCANVYRILTENQNNGTTVHKEVRYDLLDQSKSKKEKSALGDPLLMPPSFKGFVTDGPSFDIIKEHHPHILEELLERGVVFARMTPTQKMQFVVLLQQKGMVVGMCGDGANDCGALKTAHVGVALSEEEASVAAPFTSKVQNISCIPTLIREGRAALTTSFAAFKFMALYSMIQFTSVIILNTVLLYLGDFQFLYIDIFLSIVLVMCFARSPANSGLTPVRPPTKLMSSPVIVSFASHVAIQAAIQIAAFLLVQKCSWYQGAEELHEPSGHTVHSYENTSVFTVSCFQYLIYSVLFSNGAPYRNPIYTNSLYMVAVICLVAVSFVMICWPFEWLLTVFELVAIPDWRFRASLLLLAGMNALLSYLIEAFVIPNRILRKFASRFTCWGRKPGSVTTETKASKDSQTHETEMDQMLTSL